MTRAHFTEIRNRMLRDLEKNYKKIFEDLSDLQTRSPTLYNERVAGYAKFDIDLPGTIYRLLQQKSK